MQGKGTCEAGAIARCGGCRFGCRIDRRQCGRGAMLAARSATGDGETCEHRLQLSAAAQIARLIPQAARSIERALPGDDAQRITGILAGHGGYMSLKMLGAQTGFDAGRRDTALETLLRGDLATIGEIEPSGMSAKLTDKGRRRAERQRAELDAACGEYASTLSPDEQQQLVDLLFKLSRPS